MEKTISIDEAGRVVLPKAIRDAVNLGKGGMAIVRLAPSGTIEIEPIPSPTRRFRRIGKFLVAVTDGKACYDAALDTRIERGSR
jgi:AbrB family looped-hinge helix DNA binding protein